LTSANDADFLVEIPDFFSQANAAIPPLLHFIQDAPISGLESLGGLPL
jgi:hypothetical protein